ncbi:MAG: helix-turn-helix transcriptional regulator [Fibrobacteres bacterium]|nr:helix-turn-helix transcriptional regulator [Fibrobacterota bacterium]
MNKKSQLPVKFYSLGAQTPTDNMPYYVGKAFITKAAEGLHVHFGLEIGVITAGSGLLYLDNKEYQLEQGSVYFLNGLAQHTHGISSNSDHMENVYVHIKQESLMHATPPKRDLILYEPFWQPEGRINPVISRCPSAAKSILKAYQHFQSKSDRLYTVRTWVELLNAFLAIADAVKSDKSTGEKNVSGARFALISRVVEYIHAHFQEDFAVEELAERNNMSLSYFSHLFKEVMQIAPIEYRNRIRIDHACELLASTNMKVAAIAKDCGFKSLSQFNELFIRQTGKTPREIRV